MLGVPVDRAQQRVDVEKHPRVGAGQQFGPSHSRPDARGHRVELAGMAESELPQQDPTVEGAYTRSKAVHAAGADQVDIVDVIRAAHMPAIRVASFRAGLADPDSTLGAAM